MIDQVLAGLQELGDFARRTRETLPAQRTRTARLIHPVREHPVHPVHEVPQRKPQQAQPEPGQAETRFRLTQRQQQVLDLLALGSSNRQIARTLHITEQTVKAHLHVVYHKLGVADRTEAVVTAMHRGLVNGRPDAIDRARRERAGRTSLVSAVRGDDHAARR